jgi:hypothetical protein
VRVRTAKALARRIDLDYFKHPHGLRRWRYVLSAALPLLGILWIGGYAAAGSRKPYSAGPVSTAHAFTERKCEACHARSPAPVGYRAHVTDTACMTCHDAPAHAPRQTAPPACATCHQEHAGRVQLAKVDDRFCVDCHGDLVMHETAGPPPQVLGAVGRFPAKHPEFAVLRSGAKDPGGLLFNHAVHLKKEGVRGPNGPEQLQCSQCHRPEAARSMGRRALRTGLMAPVNYYADCARCHPLFFDERIDARVPHDRQPAVRDFMKASLDNYIARHPDEIDKPDDLFRRVPLNFPRPVEPPARTGTEWVDRRLAFDERLMWNKTCAECHVVDRQAFVEWKPGVKPYPIYLESKVTARWMPHASFEHAAHQMVQCQSCHAADTSKLTSDVLMPSAAACATCHAPDRGAETRCFECHQYHDWTRARPVTAPYTLTDFK